jgi:hypothetical protein
MISKMTQTMEHSLGLARVDKGQSLIIYGRRSDRGLAG